MSEFEYLPKTYLTSTTELYNRYQQRYADEPRESDKVLLRLVRDIASDRVAAGDGLSLLDIGCSTGNLLFHLRETLPGLRLYGGDVAEQAIAACRSDERLSGISFDVMNLFELPRSRFDVIVANALLFFFDEERFSRAVASVVDALRPSGWFVAFDYFHHFPHELKIIEVSRSHPDGFVLHLRSMDLVRTALTKHGFGTVEFFPFVIPIDLERDRRVVADDDSGFEDLNSYTVRAETGDRLLFRGAMFQPWCHLRARKA